MGLLDTIGTVVGIAGTVKGIVGKPKASATGVAGAAATAESRAAASRAEEIARMLRGGMTDEEFARLVGEEQGQIKSNYIKALNLAREQERRDIARVGRGTPAMFVNPERRDEARAAALASLFENAQSKAKQNVRDLLTAAANVQNIAIGGYTGAAGAAAPLAGQERAAAASDYARLVEGLTAAPQLAKDIGGLFGGGTSAPTTNTSQTPLVGSYDAGWT